jgi:hypothetical protein
MINQEIFVMTAARIIQIISGIAGLGALILGLTFWITNSDLINIHMLFGFSVAIILLIMSIMAVSTKGTRIWGIVGIIYAIILPIFGLTQANILVTNQHWIIQTLHMLVGIGAMVLTGVMGARYITIKKATTRPVIKPQTTV